MSLLRNISSSLGRWRVIVGPSSRLCQNKSPSTLLGQPAAVTSVNFCSKLVSDYSTFSTLAKSHSTNFLKNLNLRTAVQPLLPTILSPIKIQSLQLQQSRSVTKWSLQKGKRKTVKAVPARFYRLDWGAWIRTIVGRNKRKWKKTPKRKIRAARHVFCNATQSTLLDKMVTKFWRKRRYYVDDIYEPYHQREDYVMTARKPH